MSVTWDDTISSGDLAPATWANSVVQAIKRRGAKYVVTTDEYGDYYCDGLNDHVEIQAALDALTAGRSYKETVLLRGSFSISNAIKIPSYTRLIIDGKITLANTSNKNLIENYDLVNGNTEIEICGGILDGNGANQSNGTSKVFYFKKVNGLKISGLTAKQGRDSNLLLEQVASVTGEHKDVIIEQCIFDTTYYSYIYNVTIGVVENLIVRNNIIRNGAHVGLGVSSSKKVIVESNIIYSNALSAIYVEPLGTPEEILIKGNHCRSNGDLGIGSSGSIDNLIIVENVVKSNTAVGIKIIDNPSGALIAYNKVKSNGQYGIQTSGTSDYCEILFNDVRNNTLGQVTTVNNNNLIYGNRGDVSLYQTQTGSWANPSGAPANGTCVVVYNSTQAAHRLYCYSNGGWHYAALT